MKAESHSNAEAVLVCGLGSLGQSCVSALKQFGVIVYAVDLNQIRYWEIPALPNLLDGFWQGDCRQEQVLEQAKIRLCRAILLVTNDDRVNLNTAFAARALNPMIRLVVRSRQENLNELLSKQMGNFIAFEPMQLTAPAIALAGLKDETLGFFHLGNNLFRVTQALITPQHPWLHHRYLHKLNTRSRHVIHHSREDDSAPNCFYAWEPNNSIAVGDRITYLEITDKLAPFSEDSPTQADCKPPLKRFNFFRAEALKRKLVRKWQSRSQTERVALSAILLVLMLVGAATWLYHLQYPAISLQEALNVALVLILGGYDNLFGQLKLAFPIPVWLHAFSLSLTLFGTLFIGILYAMLTERVFSARIPFPKPRPSIPKANHVAIIGLDDVGQIVAALLQTLKQPCVGVNAEPLEGGILPHLPLVVDNFRDSLTKINLSSTRSVMILTKDEMTNLEIGLMVQSIHPQCPIILRTTDSQFGKHIAQFLPNASAFCPDALAAEVFAAAAFGENILSLLHLNRQTVLLTEYQIEAGDTLEERLIHDLEGYSEEQYPWGNF